MYDAHYHDTNPLLLVLMFYTNLLEIIRNIRNIEDRSGRKNLEQVLPTGFIVYPFLQRPLKLGLSVMTYKLQ